MKFTAHCDQSSKQKVWTITEETDAGTLIKKRQFKNEGRAIAAMVNCMSDPNWRRAPKKPKVTA